MAHSSRWSSVDHHRFSDEVAKPMNEIQEFPSLEYIVCPARGLNNPVTFSKQLQQCTSLKTVVVRYDNAKKVNIASLPLNSIDCLVFQYGRDGALDDYLRVLRSCADVIKELVHLSLRTEKDRDVVRHAYHVSLDHVTDSVECRNIRKLTVNLYHS
ncbi:hypothetical protein PM082_012642 [Marasmius tenuissimus]|nr:hypothetical protein PM082_012642 [Marasmius tenuissimus]